MPTFNTERLKQLTSYAIQGAGFNKLFELSTLMGIKVENDTLYLNTTDGTNYLRVSDKCVADDLDVTVNAELFAKLISKLNSETVDINVVDYKLEVVGNGKYTLELTPDETGEKLSFPDRFPTQTTEIGKVSAIDLSAIKTTLQASLSSVAGNIYTNYYFGDVVASTDKAMAGIFSRKLFDEPYIFNREFIDLVALGGEEVTFSKSADMVVAKTMLGNDCSICVCTKLQANVSDYNIEGINKFANLEVNSFCRIRKVEMLDLLDRLSLFVSKFDDGAIQLHFTNEYVEVSSIASSGVEQVEYVESKSATDITIKINIERLRNQLKSYSSDMVDLYYGSEICIKLIDGDITQVIALIK